MSLATLMIVDLIGYSTTARGIDDLFGADGLLRFNTSIQGLIDQALAAAGADRAANVKATTGDGAILWFDEPPQALSFAHALQRESRDHNATKSTPGGKLVFRIGVATGDVAKAELSDGSSVEGGMVFVRAARFEPKADPGGVLIDRATWEAAGAADQALFKGPETIEGKRDEKFTGYRALLNPDGPADAEAFASSAPSAKKPDKDRRRQIKQSILGRFPKLKPTQYDFLMISLDIPLNRKPPATITREEQSIVIMNWADEEDQLEELLSEMDELLGV